MNRRGFTRGLAGFTAGWLSQSAFGINVPAVSDHVIRVGQSAVLSGMSAGLGLEMQEGMLACFQSVNHAGGIHGRLLQLLSLDDGYEPNRTQENTRQLLDHGVVALAGYVGTPTTLAALPMIVKAGIPLIGTCSGSDKLRKPFHREVFNIRAGYSDEGPPIVKLLTAFSDTPRIALFVQADTYGEAVQASIENAMKARGLEVVAIARIPRNSNNVADAVKTICKSRPTGLALGTVYEPAGEIVKGLHSAGCYPIVASVSFIGTSNLTRKMGATAAGMGVCEVMPFPSSGTIALTREYLAAIGAAGFEPSYGSIEGFVTAKTLIIGAQKAGHRLTPDTLMTALEGVHDLGGFLVEFRPGNHSLGTFTDLVAVGEDGKIVR